MIHKVTLTDREFCQAVGISRITASRLRKQGKLPHCRIGSKILYLLRHVDEFLASHEIQKKGRRRNAEGSEKTNQLNDLQAIHNQHEARSEGPAIQGAR